MPSVETRMESRRGGRPVRLGVVVLAVAAAIAGALAPAAPAAEAQVPHDDPGRGLVYRGLHRGDPAGPCAGLFEVDRVPGARGPASCTHGPDPAPPGVDPTLQRVAAGTGSGSSAAVAAPLPCVGTGSDGFRVQVIYAHASDVADGLASWDPLFRRAVSAVDNVLDYSAFETGGSQHVRWLTDASCNAIVTDVTLTPSGDDSLANTAADLRAQGFNATNRKYLVFVDAAVYCGIAEFRTDDSSSTAPGANLNNGNATVPGMVARVDRACWGQDDPVEAHELMHTLGSVQGSAPHATLPISGQAHCYDDYDRMCYQDGPGVTVQIVCPLPSHERRYDCNHDDYYNTNPAAGSYLATHWNTANSAFLTAVASPPGPPANDAFASAQVITGQLGTLTGLTNAGATKQAGEPSHGGNAGGASVWFKWTAPLTYKVRFDTIGSDFDTLLGVYTGTAVGSLSTVASNDDGPNLNGRSKVVFSATAGTTYWIAVDGKNGTVGSLALHWASISVVPDFDGNGTTDIAVYRPSTGTWFVRGGANTVWGTVGDRPVPADYDGDNVTDIAVYRPSNGTWYVRGGAVVAWGQSNDVPVPADYDGDGTADIAVFRPSTGTWFVRGGVTTVWGQAGDIPVPADYDGDGKVDIAVYRPSTGIWYIQGVVPGVVAWGGAGDIPVPGDYFGQGRAVPTVFRPSTGQWFFVGSSSAPVWGNNGDVPAPGDYGGGGSTNAPIVFRPSTGQWFFSNTAVQWGANGDVPLSLPTAIYKAFF